MSFIDDLLTILFDYSGGYRRMRQFLREPTRPNFRSYKGLKESTLRVTFTRLKKRGLADNKNRIWAITEAGRRYYKETILRKKQSNDALNNRRKNMIITFDVPESDRYKRNWLRSELAILGFSSLQKSVWFGPAHLPKDFIKALSEKNMLGFIKFFKATEQDLV